MKRRNKIYTGAAVAALLMGTAVAVPQTIIPQAAITASAANTISCGDWDYEEIDSVPGTAKLIKYNGNEEYVLIPEAIDGHTVTQLGSGLFQKNTSITKVAIPRGITEIPSHCFWGATNLESVAIPQGVKKIGFRAFSYTPKLDSVTLSTVCEEIGYGAFDRSGISYISIPSATLIGDYAFSDCKNLKSITLPNNLKTLNRCAFQGCTKLESVSLPESLTCISSYLFANCESLKVITLPNNLKTINNNAFGGCINLESVTFNNGLEEIGDSAFERCSALTNITIPESLKSISGCCFSESGLTEFESQGAITIKCSAFTGANNLTKVTLSGKEVLEPGAFSHCENLSNLVVPISGNLDWSYNAFDGCENLFYINNKEVNCSYSKEKNDMVFDRNDLYPFIHKYFNASTKVGFVDKYVKKYCEGVVNEVVKPGMSKLQIAKALHDWVIAKVNYEENDDKLYAPKNHCDVSIFLNDQTVCDGYARGYSLLMEEAGFDPSYHSNNIHAWNKIKIDDMYFYVDTCWDDTGDSKRKKYEWFMLTGKEVIQKEGVDHSGANTIEPLTEIPMGDLNMDKVVNEADVKLMKKELETPGSLNEKQLILADLDFNGTIDGNDSYLLDKKYADRFDLNGDGEANNIDWALRQFILTTYIKVPNGITSRADNNNDGVVNSKDAKEMRYYLDKYCNGTTTPYYRMGDLNLDGTVDKNDLIAFQEYGNNHISFKANTKLADLNCDGLPDEDDYKILKELTKYQLGDVDFSGTVDSTDIELIKKHIAKSELLPNKAHWYADLNGDGAIDDKDLAMI